MLNNIKKHYCFYVSQMLLDCKNHKELDKRIDYLIDKNNAFDDCIEGDEDIKNVLKYVYHYRLFNRNILQEEPSIKTKTLANVFIKSIF